MQSLSSFDRHFAHLVWLLAHRGDDQEAQKEALRMAMAELTEKRHDLVASDVTFAVANTYHDSRLDELFVWLSELSVRMSAHSVRGIEFERNASAVDILGIARALTTQPMPGDEGASFDDKVVALAPKSLAVRIGGMGFVRRPTPIAQHAVPVATSRTPTVGMPHVRWNDDDVSDRHQQLDGPMDDLILDNPAAQPVSGKGIADETTQIIETQLAPGLAPASKLKDLLARLDSTNDVGTTAKLIDDVAREAEERSRNGLWVDLALVLEKLHERADRIPEGELRRGYQFAIRRLEKPALMHGVARLLPRRRELRDVITRLMARAGETGADALIDLLVGSESTTERHAYRNALSQCPAAVPALVHLLGDGRWYVVRNAVELLAELSPTDADAKVAPLLGHGEPRVRRAVASALTKLGTPRAVLALLQSVHDPSPEVRLQVALGLGTIRNPRAVPWLIEALDKEPDHTVQGAMLSALGKMPTEDAVARLARAVEPGGMLLRKPTAIRLHAVEALVEAGTPSAQGILGSLMNDRDRDVRETVNRLLSNRARAVGES